MSIKNLSKIIFIIGILAVFFIWQNNGVVITKHEYKSEKIPKGFDGYKILHISDLHNKNFYGRLSKKIKNINPDIIVITGDLIDRRKTRLDVAIQFIKEIYEIAPIYYVSGNHEQSSGSYNELKKELRKFNVSILDNSYLILNNTGDMIGLMGIADQIFSSKRRKISKKQ